MPAKGAVLPLDLLASQLSTLEILQAMYYGDDELVLDPRSADHVRDLGELLSLSKQMDEKMKDSLPDYLDMTFTLQPEDNMASGLDPSSRLRKAYLDVQLPIRGAQDGHFDLVPRMHLRSPDWLSRSEYEALCREALVKPGGDGRGSINEDLDNVSIITSALERLNEAMRRCPSINEPSQHAASPSSHTMTLSSHVLRTWHYLPSLSTKSKRDDLVSYAASNKPPITGFVLAGKPGLIVLEASLLPDSDGEWSSTSLRDASASLDAYWRAIKSESWADIPASHKKVSERLREETVERAFYDMVEITRAVELGRMRGAKGNRSEMGRVAEWLKGNGVGGRLEKVLGAEWGTDGG